MEDKLHLVRLERQDGLDVKLSNFGARILSIKVPTHNGPVEVHEYHHDHGIYESDRIHSGATIGPFANRIAQGKFSIGDKDYAFETNWRDHLLHFGDLGWHQRYWAVMELTSDMVTFELKSSDRDPIEFKALVTYMITMDQGLMIQYEVVVQKPFHINMTNHGYFNLSNTRDLSSHQFQIMADQITEIDHDSIPTGTFKDVIDTPFDLRQMQAIGNLAYDHNYILRKEPGTMSLAAVAKASDTRIKMECYTTQPGLQFFNGYSGFFCFESQHFPDSPNHSHFPSTLVSPEKGYREQCLYRFFEEKKGEMGLL